jgi:cytidylate kinase
MTVITISREIGSEGTQIAKEVAAVLDYHFVDKATIVKMLSQYGFIRFGQEYETLPGLLSRFDSRRAEMVEMLNRVIFALAAHGNVVILGRGSFALLAGYADVLNIRTQAPLPVRIMRIMKQQNSSPIEAETLVNENDVVRANFIESSYNVRWDTTTLFDLVINTSKVPPESAVNWLVEINDNLGRKGEDSLPSTNEIDVQSVLATVVSETLDCQGTH